MGQIILENSWFYTQAVTQRCCVTKVLLKTLQSSQENTLRAPNFVPRPRTVAFVNNPQIRKTHTILFHAYFVITGDKISKFTLNTPNGS